MRATRLTLLPLTLWLASGAAMAATVYKWVDAQGVTHYSDQPHPDAKTIDVAPVQTYHSSPAPASTGSSANSASPAGPSYTTCELFRPENDEVFLNTSTITARLRLEPQLRPGDSVSIAIDGKRVPNQPTAGTEFVIGGVERGTHTVTVGVYDTMGKQRCLTPAVTFHVRQPSVQAPVRATRPKF
jgi:uncharacterized protein DUF4124